MATKTPTIVPKVLFIMADYGHDPSETAVPYTAFKNAGFEIFFATENGKGPECDTRMLKGWTQKLLGATSPTITQYTTLSTTPSFTHPLSWTSPTFTLTPYHLIFLPGGHDRGVRQVLDSPIVQKHLSEYFITTWIGDAAEKRRRNIVAAVCHGVLVVANSRWPTASAAEDSETGMKIPAAAREAAEALQGKSLMTTLASTALPSGFEKFAYWSTRLFLGDYYKTYGAGSADVEEDVKKVMEKPGEQWKGSLGQAPLVVEDGTWGYVSARFPGDVERLGEVLVRRVGENLGRE